jgi:arsenate reductase (glutaredoxin)
VITLYGITTCDTVRRARAWLGEAGVAHEFHDFKQRGVPDTEAHAWVAALGWEALVNRQGSTWRGLDPAEQSAVVNQASALALMHRHSSVIKRPVVRWADGSITVGFKLDAWLARLK